MYIHVQDLGLRFNAKKEIKVGIGVGGNFPQGAPISSCLVRFCPTDLFPPSHLFTSLRVDAHWAAMIRGNRKNYRAWNIRLCMVGGALLLLLLNCYAWPCIIIFPPTECHLVIATADLHKVQGCVIFALSTKQPLVPSLGILRDAMQWYFSRTNGASLLGWVGGVEGRISQGVWWVGK